MTLYSSVHYPGDYGFVVGTRCDADDPLDVLILVEEPTFPGCRVRVRPIGVLLRTKARPTRSSWLDDEPIENCLWRSSLAPSTTRSTDECFAFSMRNQSEMQGETS